MLFFKKIDPVKSGPDESTRVVILENSSRVPIRS